MFRRIYFGLCSFRGNQSQTHRIRNLQSNEGVKSSELCDIKKVETEFKQDRKKMKTTNMKIKAKTI
ncbi:hypothetical protein DWW47_11965 [Odoribacter splanchnicus]|uniref:Uncharacterized protein n=1 Tax=Odoribacter splanchnicus TaxID=28118 RepID=A0A412TYL0_9BACT|nr:hypothetical protein DWW57_00830 [Odoribacter splanchnicus]RGU75391.1 hypothetical protein DWW47_11965 [Odoribacter splanchnicus]